MAKNVQMAKATFANAQTGAGTKICEEKLLKFRFASAIIGVQRVAFLRKSSCRAATRLFLRNRVRNGKMGENFIGKSCSRNA